MKPAMRRDKILRLVEEFGEVSVEELSGRFDTSRETIRRDLTELDAIGKVRKFHGGARLAAANEMPQEESAFDARMRDRLAEKTAIARRATAFFPEGSVMFIDTGSTTIAFARELAQRRNMTVITNSPQIAGALSRADGKHTVYLIGGEVVAEGRETLGPLATAQIANFKAEHAVLTVGAMTEGEIMDYDLRETELAKAMIARANRLTVLADHSKLGRSAVFEVAPLARIERLVTDRPPAAALAARLSAAGVEIVIAEGVP